MNPSCLSLFLFQWNRKEEVEGKIPHKKTKINSKNKKGKSEISQAKAQKARILVFSPKNGETQKNAA